MKVKALQKLRQKLNQNEPIYGLWVTLESASITEMAVALGLDWVVIDAEHGHLDWKDINSHIRAALRSDTVVLVRIAERSTILSKRALDIGADGIMIPWMEKVEEVEEAVRDCRYPLEGRRGIGGERATAWGQCLSEHAAEANENVLIVPLIESIAAIPNVATMCEVDGIDLFFFGPADFSSTAGFRGQWEGPGVAEQILRLKDTINAAGKHCGVVSTSTQNLTDRLDQGFRMLALGTDSGLLLRSLHQSLQEVDRDRLPATSLDPADGRVVSVPLAVLPPEYQSTRKEVLTQLDEGKMLELQSGVLCESLVGKFNDAKNLTTSIVTFEGHAFLDCHSNPVSESITVLEGCLEVIVEGRVYLLEQLENIVIPRWIPHTVRNPEPNKPAKLHSAIAMSETKRELVSTDFKLMKMPSDSTGTPGMERVNRFQSAKRDFNIGPKTEFINFFNDDLMPGIEMSGGFGRFEPGGRLQTHIHDFDESICITSGEATCIVGEKSYILNNCTTALIPRGRPHYFINESKTTMDMIWVYAGPMPERIILEDACLKENKRKKK